MLAYSGGVDSHVLLHAVWQLAKQQPDWQLSAIHVNHGLSANAAKWQQHCQQVCQDLHIPLQCVAVKVNQQSRTSLEAEARQARYQALAEHTPANAKVLLAQHQDDQLETLLLQLKRGAGPKGLAGMGQVSQQYGLTLIRPLLQNSRQQILDYAQAQQLVWQEDESNQDERFERNFLRQQILPELRKRWPQLAATASRSAGLCAEQQALLDEVSEERLASLATGAQIRISGLQAYSQRWQKQLLRSWLTRQNATLPSSAQLAQICAMLTAKPDAQPQVNWQRWQLRRYQDALYLLTDIDETCPAQTQHDQGQQRHVFQLTNGQLQAGWQPITGSKVIVLNVPQCAPLNLCYNHFSQRFRPQGSPHSKPLNQWFKQWQIPPWQRPQCAILRCNQQVLGIQLPHGWQWAESEGEQQLYLQPLPDQADEP